MKDSEWLEIEDAWCREMAKQASHDLAEIEERITTARGQRLIRHSQAVTEALEKEIAMLQRVREELESDIESWRGTLVSSDH